jgi:hypothetical protein
VVVIGETDVEPEATGVTTPTLVSIENEVAFVVVHDNTEGEPDVTEVGFAVSVQVGAEGGGGGGGVPPHVGSVIWLLSSVTWVCAKARPFKVAPVASEMRPVCVIIVPSTCEPAPMVIEVGTCQKTLHAVAPLIKFTVPAPEVVMLESLRKM